MTRDETTQLNRDIPRDGIKVTLLLGSSPDSTAQQLYTKPLQNPPQQCRMH